MTTAMGDYLFNKVDLIGDESKLIIKLGDKAEKSPIFRSVIHNKAG